LAIKSLDTCGLQGPSTFDQPKKISVKTFGIHYGIQLKLYHVSTLYTMIILCKYSPSLLKSSYLYYHEHSRSEFCNACL